VNRSFLVPVHRDLPSAAPYDGAFPRGNLPVIVDIAFGEVILELLGDVCVFPQVVGGRPELDA